MWQASSMCVQLASGYRFVAQCMWVWSSMCLAGLADTVSLQLFFLVQHACALRALGGQPHWYAYIYMYHAQNLLYIACNRNWTLACFAHEHNWPSCFLVNGQNRLFCSNFCQWKNNHPREFLVNKLSPRWVCHVFVWMHSCHDVNVCSIGAGLFAFGWKMLSQWNGQQENMRVHWLTFTDIICVMICRNDLSHQRTSTSHLGSISGQSSPHPWFRCIKNGGTGYT